MFFHNKKCIILVIILFVLINVSSVWGNNDVGESIHFGESQNGINASDVSDDCVDMGAFDELNRDISNLKPGDVYNIDKDYCFIGDASRPNSGIVIDADNITINGNGHVVDGRHASSLFDVNGNNVRIYNLTFIDSQYHGETFRYYCGTQVYEYIADISPINWIGDNGHISDCVFSGNAALNGGAISWYGNNGIVDNVKFINNTARGVGGAIYVVGWNNVIRNSTFINSSSRLSGEAIYLDRNHRNCSISGFFNVKPCINGSKTDIDVNILHYSFKSWACGFHVDLIPIIYSCMLDNRKFRYDDTTIYFALCNRTEFTLNFARTFDDGKFIYGKNYNFHNITNLNDVFPDLIQGDYDNGFTFIENFVVHNQNDYEIARKITASVFISNPAIEIINKDCDNIGSFSIYKTLMINFAGAYTFNSKSTWHPSGSDFDYISINGNGSKISVSSGDRDENKWAVIDNNKTLFSVSNLQIGGFNTAVENLGGGCVFDHVTFAGNRMNYWFERDYGAAVRNSGVCTFNNCTFTNNYCKYGGAIFSQGVLELNDCTFTGNTGYGGGNDVCNADKGSVKVDDIQINDTRGIVYHAESLSYHDRTVISVFAPLISLAAGFAAGALCANPVVGVLVGAAVGACIGTTAAVYICSNVYDVNFSRLQTALILVISCTVAGAIGGYTSSYLVANYGEAFAGCLEGGPDLIAYNSETSSLLSDTISVISEISV